ncbi:MAG: hypothetical protein KBS94_08950 [Prevotella sp.]|nr:hypothetical protein [Candidatus Equicola faecalis]
MKKIFFALVAATFSISINAQVMKIMKDNQVVATYSAEQANKVVFEEQAKDVSKDVVGVWYCTFQQWTEDGDTWSSTYEPSSEYMMAFEEDGTGYMKSGKDELFEIGTHGIANFNWYGYRKSGKNWIHEDYRNHDYEITSISSSSLTLTWRAPNSAYGYTIVGKFIKMK